MHPNAFPSQFSRAGESDPAQFDKFVNHWCPPGFRGESFNGRIMRAFLAAVSCVDQYQRRDRGEPVIRPIDSYPTPAYPPGGTGL